MTISRADVVDHFTARADRYDRSSSWCTDDELAELIVRLAQPEPSGQVLDVACGTGLVSRHFGGGRAGRVVGLDITTDMADQAKQHVDELVIAPAEDMPFPDATFDAVVSRQGIQFMELPAAIEEMVRVTRPGGRIVLVNLCAYGPEDRDEYYEILRLRNPVRRHFFLPDELTGLLRDAGCDPVTAERHVSVEDVDVWSDNGAIEEERREAIRAVYRSASPEFNELHAVRQVDGRFVDNMLFVAATGVVTGEVTGR
jgi:SAM-dependent methyltransferase